MKPIAPHVKSKTFVLKLAAALALLGVGVYLLLLGSVLSTVFGVVVIGAMFAHAVELQHQCLHNTAFKTRATNRIVGILLGLPMLSSFHAYRRAHMEHHRSLGTPNDVPYFAYRFLERPTIGSFLYDLFGVAHLKGALSAILLQGKSGLITVGSEADDDYTAECIDYALMAFMIGCLYLYTLSTGSSLLVMAWLVPMLLVAQPIHFLIELPEHLGCAEASTDPYRNTRTIIGSRFSRWFTNGNNFHVEHHLAAALSMDQLEDLYLQSLGRHQHYNRSYVDFYTSILRLVGSRKTVLEVDQTARRPA